MSAYFTIGEPSEGIYKEKGSKFLAFAFPVTSDEDIKDRLHDLRKTYYDARHHCYAYILGMDDQTSRANDDGEPSHSAGDPILGQIRSFGLTNVLLVVVRYFGGTKLGVGGLIQAYKTAAGQALSEAGKVEIFEKNRVEMKFNYDLLSAVERLVTDFDIEVIERDFQQDCCLTGYIKKDFVEEFRPKTTKLYNLKFWIY